MNCISNIHFSSAVDADLETRRRKLTGIFSTKITSPNLVFVLQSCTFISNLICCILAIIRL